MADIGRKITKTEDRLPSYTSTTDPKDSSNINVEDINKGIHINDPSHSKEDEWDEDDWKRYYEALGI